MKLFFPHKHAKIPVRSGKKIQRVILVVKLGCWNRPHWRWCEHSQSETIVIAALSVSVILSPTTTSSKVRSTASCPLSTALYSAEELCVRTILQAFLFLMFACVCVVCDLFCLLCMLCACMEMPHGGIFFTTDPPYILQASFTDVPCWDQHWDSPWEAFSSTTTQTSTSLTLMRELLVGVRLRTLLI